MSDQGYFGQQRSADDTSDYNVADFHIRQRLGMVRTSIPVQVVTVHGGGTGVPPTVDVLPLVNMIDSVGNRTKHLTVFGVPAIRVQGGGNAVICDPVAGDIGLLMVSDRDISAVKATAKQANPGSYRRFNLSDGIYIGAMIKGSPSQFVQFTPTGITISDKNGNTIVMGPSGVNINGMIVDQTGNVTTPQGVTAGYGGADSVTLQQHVHPSNGAPPTPGT